MAKAPVVHTTQKWSTLLAELANNMERWGIEEWLPPNWDRSYKEKRVTVSIARNGVYTPLACGSQSTPEQNLKALCIAIHSVRLAEARGIAFTMYEALRIKALASGTSPYAVLGVQEGERDQDTLKAAYRQKAKETHPDYGGETKDFLAVQHAAEELGVA